MKNLIFILGLTLCTALPSLRVLQHGFVEPIGQILEPTVIEPEIYGPDSPPEWLFEGSIPSGEGEEVLEPPGEEQNGEETLPEEGQEEEQEEKDLLTTIKEDSEVSIIFDFGVEAVIDSGIKKDKIPNKTFTVTNVSAMSTVSSNTEERYKFSCEALSEDGTSVINMNFTVAHDLRTGKNTLPSFSYIVNTTTTIPVPPQGVFVKLTPVQIAGDAEVQAMLDYGVDLVIQKGVEKGKIPISNYVVTKIVSVQRMRQKNKTTYKFNVELKDAEEVLIKTNFIVSINSQTKQKLLSSFSYQISNIKFSIDESGYVQVSQEELEKNAVIMECLEMAIEEAVNSAEGFGISKINVVYTQTLNGVVYYKFNVELSNNKDKVVELVTTVAYMPETGEKDVKIYETKTTTTTITPKN